MTAPNGAAFGPNGALYVTNNGGFSWRDGLPIGPAPDYETGRIERIDKNGNVQRLYIACDGVRLSAPNDLVFDAEGNFYFTDPVHRDPKIRESLNVPTCQGPRHREHSSDLDSWGRGQDIVNILYNEAAKTPIFCLIFDGCLQCRDLVFH